MPGGGTAGRTPDRTRGADRDAGPLDRRDFEATRPARDYAGPLVLAGPRSRGRNLLSGMRPPASGRREAEADGGRTGARSQRSFGMPRAAPARDDAPVRCDSRRETNSPTQCLITVISLRLQPI